MFFSCLLVFAVLGTTVKAEIISDFHDEDDCHDKGNLIKAALIKEAIKDHFHDEYCEHQIGGQEIITQQLSPQTKSFI